MKILEFSDFHQTGGAAIAASRIARSLNDLGHSVIRASSDSKESNLALFIGRKAYFLSLLLGKLSLNNIVKKVYKNDILNRFISITQQIEPDCILFHNLHGAGWPLEMVLKSANRFPTSWTLHDCSSFLASFYPSHSPKPNAENLLSCKQFWETYDKGRKSRPALHGVSPSSWLREQAVSGYWKSDEIITIHNPVPDYFFTNLDRKSCKKALKLNPEKKVILVIAGNLSEERKGGPIIKELMSSFNSQTLQLLVIGSECPEVVSNCENVRHLGAVKDEITLQIAYHAADILFHPAPVDNLPNTVAEAMSCGTPVLAFRTGGLPEMIIDGESGWLVKKKDSSSILKILDEIISAPIGTNFGEASRARAKKLFDSQTIGKKYVDHLSKLIFRKPDIAQNISNKS